MNGTLKLKFALFIAGLILFSPGINGQNNPAGVKLINGKKYTIHKVTSKETWTSLSKEFKTSQESLMSANPGVADLKTGQVINVPVNLEEVKVEKVETKGSKPEPEQPKNKQTETASKCHEVKVGETLYAIAKKYGVKPANIRVWNKMEKDQVNVGQKLILGEPLPDVPKLAEVKQDVKKITPEKENSKSSSTAEKQILTVKNSGADAKSTPKAESEKEAQPIPAKSNDDNKVKPEGKSVVTASIDPKVIPSVKKESDNEASNRSETVLKKSSSGKSLVQVTENGVATYIMDGELNQNKYYGLHRSAPAGTIIKVTNRMNNQYVFVKIVGLLPDTGDNDNQIIKISQAAAKRIGVLDQKFQVELSYGVMQ